MCDVDPFLSDPAEMRLLFPAGRCTKYVWISRVSVISFPSHLIQFIMRNASPFYWVLSKCPCSHKTYLSECELGLLQSQGCVFEMEAALKAEISLCGEHQEHGL